VTNQNESCHHQRQDTSQDSPLHKNHNICSADKNPTQQQTAAVLVQQATNKDFINNLHSFIQAHTKTDIMRVAPVSWLSLLLIVIPTDIGLALASSSKITRGRGGRLHSPAPLFGSPERKNAFGFPSRGGATRSTKSKSTSTTSSQSYATTASVDSSVTDSGIEVRSVNNGF
jgi:hypothetical protein